MILSRTMREDDYPELVREGRILQYMYYVTGMWWPKQERDSLWEYALAHMTLSKVFKNRKKLRVADYGYRTGHLTPMLVWLGHDVTMVELERKPPEEENFMMEHLLRVTTTRNHSAGSVAIWPKPDSDGIQVKFDAVFSLSTLACRPAQDFSQCMHLVKPGGLLFVTSSDGLSDKEMIEARVHYALLSGFKFIDGVADYDWEHQENNFVSMVMIKETE